MDEHRTLGAYLGLRLVERGVTHFYCVPGDFNFGLLDELCTVPGLSIVNCSNELNAGYAADGHARGAGLGCVVVTFTVGSLSVVNAVAGSFAEDVPVICVSGCPSTSELASFSELHHTIGRPDSLQEEAVFAPVTAKTYLIRSLVNARERLDDAITTALSRSKPVFIEVCRDLGAAAHYTFGLAGKPLLPMEPSTLVSSPHLTREAAAAAAAMLNAAKLPVIVVGRRIRKHQEAVRRFVEAARYGVVAQHEGKGMYPEPSPHFIGVLAGKGMSDPMSVSQVAAESDCLLHLGAHYDEYQSGGWPSDEERQKSILSHPRRVVVGGADAFHDVGLEDFLAALAPLLQANSAAVERFGQLPRASPGEDVGEEEKAMWRGDPDFKLKLSTVYDAIRNDLLKPGTALMVDTGDSTYRTFSLPMPEDSQYEVQLMYGSIGYATPAGLGLSHALRPRGRRVITITGEGAFHLTAGEIGNAAVYGSNAIFFLVNNGGYLIEKILAPTAMAGYNFIKRWDHCKLVEAMLDGEGDYKIFKVSTEAELREAVATAQKLENHFIFIELVVSPSDASDLAPLLRRKGVQVAKALSQES